MNDRIGAESQGCPAPRVSVYTLPLSLPASCLMQAVAFEMLSLPALLQAVAGRRGGGLGPGWSWEN